MSMVNGDLIGHILIFNHNSCGGENQRISLGLLCSTQANLIMVVPSLFNITYAENPDIFFKSLMTSSTSFPLGACIHTYRYDLKVSVLVSNKQRGHSVNITAMIQLY